MGTLKSCVSVNCAVKVERMIGTTLFIHDWYSIMKSLNAYQSPSVLSVGSNGCDGM